MSPRVIRSKPLGLVLPATVFSVFTLLLLAMVYYEYHQLTALTREAALTEAQLDISHLQRETATALARGDTSAVERKITGHGVNRDVVALALLDESGTVRYATRFAWRGQEGRRALPRFDPAAAARAHARGTPLQLEQDERLIVYAPVRLAATDHELRATRAGTLFMHQDLSGRYQAVWRVVIREALWLWLFGLAAMAVMTLALQRLIADPVRRIARMAPRLAQGNLEASVPVTGSGEIAELARAFNDADHRVRVALRELRDREATYRTIVDHAGIGILLIDRDMNVLEVNQVLRDWFPRARPGLKCHDFMPSAPEGAQCPFCQANDAMSDGRTRENIVTIPHRGEARQFRIVSSPVKGIDNGRHACVELIEDITERAAMERELDRVSRALRAMGGCNAAVLMAADEDQLFEQVCRILVEEAGYRLAWIGIPREGPQRRVEPAAAAGIDMPTLKAQDVRWDLSERGFGPMGRAIRERRAVWVSDVYDDPDYTPWHETAQRLGFRSLLALPVQQGEELFAAVAVYAAEPAAFAHEERKLLHEMADTLAYGLKSLRDRRARIDSEERLRQLNAELEARVEQRTRQLQRMNDELEAFSYSVSHDLRAPLRSIDGFSDLLLRRHHADLNAQAQDYLARVRAASQRMGQLIDDLLALSRINRHEMRIETVDLSALAATAADELAAAAPDRQVQCDIQPGMHTDGDSRMLRIVMQNLLGNAWKYTGKTPEPRIEVGMTHDEAGDTFYVRDNGAGFDPAVADKMFQPFQRLHREADFEGTGIGLATVNRILQRHNGRIWAEGAPGRGATFHFCIECAD